MSSQMTLQQLEQQIAQLPVHERLKLIAHVSEQLSTTSFNTIAQTEDEEAVRQRREKEAEELLALCDAAAGMWEGEFDALQEIHRMRQKRDEDIWLSRS